VRSYSITSIHLLIAFSIVRFLILLLTGMSHVVDALHANATLHITIACALTYWFNMFQPPRYLSLSQAARLVLSLFCYLIERTAQLSFITKGIHHYINLWKDSLSPSDSFSSRLFSVYTTFSTRRFSSHASIFVRVLICGKLSSDEYSGFIVAYGQAQTRLFFFLLDFDTTHRVLRR
jgi:hypothetical protein